VNGRLTGCKIVMSSGSASLDAQTCRIIQQRARFSPARDAQGKPIAGKVFQRVTWRLEDTLMPSGAWVARTTLIADGPVDMPACSVVGEGAIADHASLRSKCKEVLEDLGPGATGTVPQGIVATVTADEQFIPEGTSDARVPPVKTGQILLGQEVLQLSIDASGKVAKCEVVSEAGLDLATGNPCANLGMRFEPVSGKEGKPAPFTAKLITRIFVDYQAKIKPAVVSEMRSRPQAGKGQS
jgi:hypothetical protein